MRIDDLNETGIVLPAKDQLRFTYASKFYGECRFVAAVAETFERGLIIDNPSIEWEHSLPRRGGCKTLGNNAIVFFNRILRSYDSLRQFQVKVNEKKNGGLLGRISSSFFGDKLAKVTQLKISA